MAAANGRQVRIESVTWRLNLALIVVAASYLARAINLWDNELLIRRGVPGSEVAWLWPGLYLAAAAICLVAAARTTLGPVLAATVAVAVIEVGRGWALASGFGGPSWHVLTDGVKVAVLVATTWPWKLRGRLVSP